MSFLNPFFLLGMVALAAPILVHLVRRTRARRVEFPALYFVRQVPQRTIRRRTLHNLLLLLLRCLALLLVILAFTRPFFNRGSAANDGEAARASLFLIDASLSMQRGELFAEAKRRVEALMDEATEDERLALVSFGQGYEIISRFTTDQTKLRAMLPGLNAGMEGTDYEQALRGAESLFSEFKTRGLKRIFLISDFQATGWNPAQATFRLREDIHLAPIDVGGRDPEPNVAVTNVEARGVIYTPKYAERVAVEVSNFGDELRERLAVNLQINEQTVAKREVNLGARETKVVEFSGFNLAEGANRGLVSLAAEDFAHDNQFYLTLRRATPAKALIVERAARGGSESLYLHSALTTGENLPFTLEVKSAGAVDPAGLASFALVILNDAGTLPAALAEGIMRFVETGGRLIVAAGPHTDADSFNRAFQRITPASLGEAVQFQRGDSIALADVKMDHPIFEVFRNGGRLATARVFGYHRAEPREHATVIARFEDGSPALIEAEAGAKGRILLFTSTLGATWTDLPLTPAYLPLVQQMARHLGEHDATPWHRLGHTLTVPKSPPGQPPAVDAPSGARLVERSLTPEGDLLVTGREPGFYRLRYDGAHDFAAVNIEGGEGDFAKLNLDEFLAGLTGGAATAESLEAHAKLSDEEVEARQGVWWPLLLIALMLFAAEALLARRTKMVKMIG